MRAGALRELRASLGLAGAASSAGGAPASGGHTPPTGTLDETAGLPDRAPLTRAEEAAAAAAAAALAAGGTDAAALSAARWRARDAGIAVVGGRVFRRVPFLHIRFEAQTVGVALLRRGAARVARQRARWGVPPLTPDVAARVVAAARAPSGEGAEELPLHNGITMMRMAPYPLPVIAEEGEEGGALAAREAGGEAGGEAGWGTTAVEAQPHLVPMPPSPSLSAPISASAAFISARSGGLGTSAFASAASAGGRGDDAGSGSLSPTSAVASHGARELAQA
jgi:hypothetical protein